MNGWNKTHLLFCCVLYWFGGTAHGQDMEHGDEEASSPLPREQKKSRQDSAATSVTQKQIEQALRKYRHEPTAYQVIRMVLRTASKDPEAARDMASRARSAGWIPTFKVGVRRGLARDMSAYQTIEIDRTNLSTDDDLVLEASLTFDFSRLMYDRSEVSITREGRALRNEKRELIRSVAQLYFMRRRLQLERDLGLDTSLQNEMDIAEIEALLDAFTNGAFKSMIKQIPKP